MPAKDHELLFRSTFTEPRHARPPRRLQPLGNRCRRAGMPRSARLRRSDARGPAGSWCWPYGTFLRLPSLAVRVARSTFQSLAVILRAGESSPARILRSRSSCSLALWSAWMSRRIYPLGVLQPEAAACSFT